MAKKSKKTKQPERIENWEARPGIDRPTPERKSRGVFTMVDGDSAGESYAQDMSSCPLQRLQFDGHITKRQCEAGIYFEAIARKRMGGPSPKDCLMSLHRVDGGGWDEETPDEAIERDEESRAEWRSLVTLIRYNVQSELMRVCWEQGSLRSLPLLRSGLDIVADFYKIARD